MFWIIYSVLTFAFFVWMVYLVGGNTGDERSYAIAGLLSPIWPVFVAAWTVYAAYRLAKIATRKTHK